MGMKNKIFRVCLFVSLILNVILLVCLIRYDTTYERAHIDDRATDCVSDKETAEKIARVYLESLEKPLGFEEDVEYDAKVTFDERKYEWIVQYSVRAPEGYMVLDGGKKVGIRRDNGMISYYAWR